MQSMTLHDEYSRSNEFIVVVVVVVVVIVSSYPARCYAQSALNKTRKPKHRQKRPKITQNTIDNPPDYFFVFLSFWYYFWCLILIVDF